MAFAELKDNQAYIGFTLSDLHMMRDEIVGKDHYGMVEALLACLDTMIERFEMEQQSGN